jgi:hypothetical protein
MTAMRPLENTVRSVSRRSGTLCEGLGQGRESGATATGYYGFYKYFFSSSRSRCGRKSGKARGNRDGSGCGDGTSFLKPVTRGKHNEERWLEGSKKSTGFPRYEQDARSGVWKGAAVSGKRGSEQAGLVYAENAGCTANGLSRDCTEEKGPAESRAFWGGRGGCGVKKNYSPLPGLVLPWPMVTPPLTVWMWTVGPPPPRSVSR